MKAKELLNRTGMWLETALAGSLTPAVRRVMHIELSMSLAYGVFYAAIIPFIHVVLRRLGATVDMLALYTALLFVGSVFTSFSIVLMRRRRTINLIFFCWLLGRSLFLLAAFVTGAVPLMAISILFSLLESFVIPGLYARHPEDLSGKRAGQSNVHGADGAGFGHPTDHTVGRLGYGPGGVPAFSFLSVPSLASWLPFSSRASTSTRGNCRRARPRRSPICGRSCAPTKTLPSIWSATRFLGWEGC